MRLGAPFQGGGAAARTLHASYSFQLGGSWLPSRGRRALRAPPRARRVLQHQQGAAVPAPSQQRRHQQQEQRFGSRPTGQKGCEHRAELAACAAPTSAQRRVVRRHRLGVLRGNGVCQCKFAGARTALKFKQRYCGRARCVQAARSPASQQAPTRLLEEDSARCHVRARRAPRSQMILLPRALAVRRFMQSYWAFAPLALAYAALLAYSYTPDTLSLLLPGSLEAGLTGARAPPVHEAAASCSCAAVGASCCKPPRRSPWPLLQASSPSSSPSWRGSSSCSSSPPRQPRGWCTCCPSTCSLAAASTWMVRGHRATRACLVRPRLAARGPRSIRLCTVQARTRQSRPATPCSPPCSWAPWACSCTGPRQPCLERSPG